MVYGVVGTFNCQVHYANPAYERVLGRSLAYVYADPKQWAEAIPLEERERVYATFSRLTVTSPARMLNFQSRARMARCAGSGSEVLEVADLTLAAQSCSNSY
jgi:hypothetical protein